mgnify:CR=1 FL=1|jgi:hypothetical protein
MTYPRFDDVADVPLITDEHVLARVSTLVEGAYRRQLWLMFLDADQRQLPIVIPHDVPGSPSAEARREFPGFLQALVHELGAAAVVVVLERSGSDTLRRGDRDWFAVLADACAAAAVPLRGPVLCCDDGFRWIASEDFAS